MHKQSHGRGAQQQGARYRVWFLLLLFLLLLFRVVAPPIGLNIMQWLHRLQTQNATVQAGSPSVSSGLRPQISGSLSILRCTAQPGVHTPPGQAHVVVRVHEDLHVEHGQDAGL